MDLLDSIMVSWIGVGGENETDESYTETVNLVENRVMLLEILLVNLWDSPSEKSALAVRNYKTTEGGIVAGERTFSPWV